MTNRAGKKTPPHIKWLLNERAMLQGVLRKMTNRRTAYQKRFEAAQAALEKRRATFLTAHLASEEALLRKIQALTLTLDSMAPEVSPDAVGPVNAWAGKYGQRGALTAFLKERLQEAYPNSLTVPEICLAVQQKFGLVTSTTFERKNLRETIRTRLRECRAQGLVETLHIPHSGTRASIWRWRRESTTFEMLRRQEAQRDEDTPD
ncbi:hypothetical protein HF896_06335 [Alicycliphilus denitrificans]|uniref:Uncharacterized protein n=1 Tax=Alicycliphilus denitrificans TaxID=179636 RepID=A0A858ZQU1_9BURK|nr:hypothetical protein [Alicycliphilus denitrificans]QKD43250.1 hypothetical protein HF896_06335 [Alicycliphilus denitrificans]